LSSLIFALASLIVAVGLVYLLYHLFRIGASAVDPRAALGAIAMALALFAVIQLTLTVWTDYRHPDLPPAEGRDGIRWGRRELVATREDLTIRASAYTTVWQWPAFVGLKRTRHAVFLMLTPQFVIPVPNHAFRSRAELDQFCNFVSECVARAGAADGGQGATT